MTAETETDKFIVALDYAMLMHDGQKRIGGLDYIVHPLAVAEILRDKGFGLDYQIAGLFHDLLEDTKATEEKILSLSNARVLKAVKLLTKVKGYHMDEYVKAISEDEIAKYVKLADRLHNLYSAFVTDLKFQKRYLLESEKYYVPLAKGTVFETQMNLVVEELRKSVNMLEKLND